jgi:protein transport protein SEC61 subunit beta
MPAPPSSTTVGSPRSTGKTLAPRTGGTSGVWQRKAPASSSSGGGKKMAASAASAGMWRFYTEDSPGIKVGPVPVLVMSLLFIASVFMLHIWGKYTRG